MWLGQTTWFLESYDSVRYDDRTLGFTTAALEERLAHARVETLVSLVFGRPVRVPEPYSFDSVGFAAVAAEVLRAREAVATRSGEDAKRIRASPVRNPFVLCLRPGRASYRAMVSALLEKPGFVSSSMPELGDDAELRTAVAAAVAAGDPEAATTHGRLEGREEHLANIRVVDAYFSAERSGRIVPAEPPRKSLQDYAGWVLGADSDVAPTAAVRSPALRELRATLRLLQNEYKIGFTDRSQVRQRCDALVDAGLLRRDARDQAVEFIDSAYNRVVASATRARLASHTTGEPLTTAGVSEGEGLARAAHTDLEADRPSSYRNIDVAFHTDPTEARALAQALTLAPGGDWTEVWSAVWTLVANPQWQTLIGRLDQTLAAADGGAELRAMEGAIDGLVHFVGGELPKSLRFEKPARGLRVWLRFTTGAAAVGAGVLSYALDAGADAGALAVPGNLHAEAAAAAQLLGVAAGAEQVWNAAARVARRRAAVGTLERVLGAAAIAPV